MKAAAWGVLAAALSGCPAEGPPSKGTSMSETMPPGAGSAVASGLLADFRSVGLFQGLPPAEFLARLTAHFGADELEEIGEEAAGRPEALRPLRHASLARLQGIVQDWRFDPEELLRKVGAQVPGLAWTPVRRGAIRTIGKNRLQELTVLLKAGGRELEWTFSLVSGLMEGVNRVLREAGRAERFIGLATDGDYYAYVLGDAGLEERMSASPLFALKTDPDPLVR